MATIYDARSVNPDQVTPEQLDEVFTEHGITPAPAGLPDFFEPGKAYRRHVHSFRCAAVGTHANGQQYALGFMPINLGGVATFEAMFQDNYDWSRGWELVPDPGPSCGRCKRPFDPADRTYDGAAEDRSAPGYCRGCVDQCHEADAGHRCAVCKSLTERSSQ